MDCYEDEYGIEGPYDVTINIDPPLTGEISMNGFNLNESPFFGTYFGGITQEIEAFAAQDYTFDYWEFSNGTTVNGTNSSLEYTLNSNQTITAHFSPNNILILPPDNEGIIIINGSQYTSFPDTLVTSETFTIEAIPDAGFLFDSWELTNGTIDNPNSSITTVTLLGDAEIIAIYIPYPVLTLNSVPNGEVQVSGTLYNNLPQSINLYGNNTIVAIPETGYQFDYWEYSGDFINNTSTSNSTIEILSNASLTAYFSKIEIEIYFDISHTNGGEIRLNNEIISDLPSTKIVFYGDNNNVQITLNTNYLLEYWEIYNPSTSNIYQESFDISFTENDTIIAQLERLLTLTINIEPQNAGIVLGNGVELLLAPNSQLYNENTEINLQAIPEIDMIFDQFVQDQGMLTYNSEYEYTIEHNDTLRVLFSEKDLTLYIPNSFTPNGDLLNDVFMPIGIPEKIKDFEMQIFNNWGEQVFETKNIQIGWDAKEIEYSSNAIFFYKITLHSSVSNRKFEYKGTLLVL